MEKIKQMLMSDKGKDVLTVLIVVLVGIGSFGLGRLSKTAEEGQFKVEYGSKEASLGLESSFSGDLEANAAYVAPVSKSSSSSGSGLVPPIGKNFLASKRGHKYYPVGCSAGKSIVEANRIWFGTGEEAEKAGYELSSSC